MEHTVRMLLAEEKTGYDKVVLDLKKEICSFDIEELCGLEFNLMQANKSMEHHKLGHEAFPTSGAKAFDRIIKRTFLPSTSSKVAKQIGTTKGYGGIR